MSASSHFVPEPARRRRAGRLAASLLTASFTLAAIGEVVTTAGTGAATLPQWNATAEDLPMPFTATTTQLGGISCDSPGSCTAVGYSTPSPAPTSTGNNSALVDTLSGGSWQASQPSIGTADLYLVGDSCLTGWCMAVGTQAENLSSGFTDVPVAAVETGGNWTFQDQLGGIANGALNSVTCTSQSFCVAVGVYYDSSQHDEPLVMDYNGSTWEQMSFPSLESVSNFAELFSISCFDATDCAAVGESQDPNGSIRSLAIVLTDGTWTPEVLGLQYPSIESASYLNGVSCAAAQQCEAVGAFVPAGGGQWQGLNGTIDGTGAGPSNWHPDYSLQSPAGTSYVSLSSVSCVTPSSCVAVGEVQIGAPPSLRQHTLIRTGGGFAPNPVVSGIAETITDGSANYIEPVAPAASPYAYLTAVSCASDYSCEAIGSDDNTSAFAATGYSPPTITSADSVTFTQGTASSFDVQAQGAGPVTLSESGALPRPYNGESLTFTDSNSGTGTDTGALAGTPSPYTGTYDIQFTATDAGGNTVVQDFTVTVDPVGPVPTISSVTPSQGGAGGGTAVNLIGANFTGAIDVLFGGVPAESFLDVTPTYVTAVAPPGTGTVDVTVVGPGGQSTQSLQDEYTYALPVVSSATPPSAPAGAEVTLQGQFLNGTTQVLFAPGGLSPSFTVDADGTSLTAVIPCCWDGPTEIIVSSPAGPYYFNGFSYAPPAITKVSPASGPTGGGNEVQIIGTDFYGVSSVDFGFAAASVFKVNATDTVISVIAPTGPAGLVPIYVHAYLGLEAVDFGAYTFGGPTVDSVAPAQAATGSLVTVTGSGLYDATSVDFGGTIINSNHIYENSPTTLVVQVPYNTGGSIATVSVTTPQGTSPDNPYATFTWETLPGP